MEDKLLFLTILAFLIVSFTYVASFMQLKKRVLSIFITFLLIHLFILLVIAYYSFMNGYFNWITFFLSLIIYPVWLIFNQRNI